MCHLTNILNMRILTKNKSRSKVIAITAGGTGGHIFPALTIARMFLQEGYRVLFYTDKKFFNYIKSEDVIFRSEMIKLIQLKAKNTTRLKQIFIIFNDLFKCKDILTQRASVCVGFGGVVSFAPMLFGILFFKKTIIHEQNAVLGLANRILLPFVNKCCTSFTDTIGIAKCFTRKCVFTGNPIRPEIKKLVYNYDNPSVNYRAFYKIDDVINLTITGGSQACSVFDELLPQAIAMLPPSIINKLHIKHQCKHSHVDTLELYYTENGISHDVRPFFYNIGEILRASHLVISRAGSTTIAEISALGVPSILIPLPTSANNHQYHNAKFLRDNNATILLEQSHLTKESLCHLLLNLFNHDVSLFELSQCCRRLAPINADYSVFKEINKTLNIDVCDCNTTTIMHAKDARYINDNIGLG